MTETFEYDEILSNLNSELTKKESEISNITVDLKLAQKVEKELRNELDELRKSNKILNSIVYQQRNDVNESAILLDFYKKDRNDLVFFRDGYRRREVELNHLRLKCEELQSNIQELNDLIIRLSNQVTSLEYCEEELQGNIQDLNDEVDSLKNERDPDLKKYTELETEYHKLNVRYTASQNNINIMSDDKKYLKAYIVQLTDKLNNSNQESNKRQRT
jgi:DNA repair exonuclease SbcCD ATPase subunit